MVRDLAKVLCSPIIIAISVHARIIAVIRLGYCFVLALFMCDVPIDFSFSNNNNNNNGNL